MPEENNPADQQQPPQGNREDWQRLAEEAAEWPEDHEGLQQFRENHVNRVIAEQGLGHLTNPGLAKDDKAGARFVHKHGSLNKKEVDNVIGYLRNQGKRIPDKAGDRTATFLSFMADTVNDGILTGEPGSVKRQIEAHVIKPEEVPESYFELQRRIAREQGYGDIPISSDIRRQLIEAVRADQRGSLEKWVEYLGGNDGSYPNWFRRYTWDSVLKLGAYDKEKAKFDKRDTDTVAPYPEINREALAYTYDIVKKFHVVGDTVEDAQLKQILKEGSFGRIYAHAILEVTPDSPELRREINGSWTKFKQTNDPRTARRLSGSLQGHGTGWCTAGDDTAEVQLEVGDFYVYYTKDEDGKDTIPRVAIRMQGGEVVEVRGVLPRQELEPALIDIASEKLNTLPGGDTYMQKAEDMKRLTAIEQKLGDNPRAELTKEELKFLYELDHKIQGFGYDDDPRVDEIRRGRVLAVDIATVTGIDINETDHNTAIADLIASGYGEFVSDLLNKVSLKDLSFITLELMYRDEHFRSRYEDDYSIDDINEWSLDQNFAEFLHKEIDNLKNIPLWAAEIMTDHMSINEVPVLISQLGNFDEDAKEHVKSEINNDMLHFEAWTVAEIVEASEVNNFFGPEVAKKILMNGEDDFIDAHKDKFTPEARKLINSFQNDDYEEYLDEEIDADVDDYDVLNNETDDNWDEDDESDYEFSHDEDPYTGRIIDE